MLRAIYHKGATVEGSKVPFTEYVRLLSLGTDPDMEQFGRMWAALTRSLQLELRWRGLRSVYPSYLGILGWPSWTAGAIDDLATDCYIHVFIDRLPNLKAHLEVKPNIDGIVRRSIRQFVHDRQRQHDPLGYRLFELLREALEEEIADGNISVLGRGRRIGNNSILVFEDACREAGDLMVGKVFDEVAERWSNTHLLDMLSQRSSREASVLSLRRSIREVQDLGVVRFNFKDLLNPIKSNARRQVAAFFAVEEGSIITPKKEFGESEVMKMVDSANEVEEELDYHRLVEGVKNLIDDLKVQARVKNNLRDLWDFIAGYARDCLGRELPSDRQLSNLLGIRRKSVRPLLNTLKDLVSDWQESSSLSKQ